MLVKTNGCICALLSCSAVVGRRHSSKASVLPNFCLEQNCVSGKGNPWSSSFSARRCLLQVHTHPRPLGDLLRCFEMGGRCQLLVQEQDFYFKQAVKRNGQPPPVPAAHLKCSCSCSCLGDPHQFEQKFNYRRPMYPILRYMWGTDSYRQSIKVRQETHTYERKRRVHKRVCAARYGACGTVSCCWDCATALTLLLLLTGSG